MPLSSAFLIMLAALLHAGWNLLAKRAAGIGPVFVFAYAGLGTLAYTPLVVWLLAAGGVKWSLLGGALILLSAAIHLAYSLCLQRGYQVAELSVVYPVARGTGPMLATAGAILLLGERPTWASITGLLLVVIGIGLIATRGDLDVFRRPAAHAGLRWGVATGALIAAYTIGDAYAVKVAAVAPLLLDWASNLLRTAMLTPHALADWQGTRARMRGHWGIALAVGIMSSAAYILVLMALRNGAPLSLAAPMREMSMMVGALLGMVVLRERVGGWRFVGCGLLMAGVAFLSAA